jgi:hypothetical protein
MAEPEQVWYGFCTYWTDDWGQLSRVKVKGSPSGIEGRAVGVLDSGIPCCPDCGSVGYQMDKTDWEEGVERLEASEPGYAKFLAGVKELCHGKGISLGSLWEEHKKELDR